MQPEQPTRIAALNHNMAEKRAALADLMHALKQEEAALAAARTEHFRLGRRVTELTRSTETLRKRIFALRIELEGHQRTRVKMRATPGAQPEADTEESVSMEQRHHGRAPFEPHVNFGGLGGFYSGFVLNVSDGGMLVATCDPPEVGRRFAVEFALSGGEEPIRAPVEAIWVRRGVSLTDEAGYSVAEVGLRFVEMSPRDRGAVHAYTRAYEDRPRVTA